MKFRKHGDLYLALVTISVTSLILTIWVPWGFMLLLASLALTITLLNYVFFEMVFGKFLK
jgi:hypothetical protein